MARQIEYFLPCFLVVFASLCLGLVGLASYFYMQGPGGVQWLPDTPPPTVPFAAPTVAPPPPPPVLISLHSADCPLQLCELRDIVVEWCDQPGASDDSLCIIDDLRPTCVLGTCVRGRCEAEPAYLLTHQCECRCD